MAKILSIEEYYKKHPNATIEEYFEYEKKTIEDENLAKRENEKALDKFYKSLLGKCFKITLKSNHDVVYVRMFETFNEGPMDLTFKNAYWVRTEEFNNRITFDKGIHYLNPIWFNPPSISPKANEVVPIKCEQISKEEFIEVGRKYESVNNLIKEII